MRLVTPKRLHLSIALSAIGIAVAFIAVIDPFRETARFIGPAFAIAAALVAQRRVFWLAAVIAIFYGASSSTLIEFRADSSSYFAYLRSVSFDLDLDFKNDWDLLRDGAPAPFPTRREINVFSAGPAVLWSPFFWAAHTYVTLDNRVGRELYAADGASLPYRRSTLAGTIAIVVLGASLLTLTLARRHGKTVALVATLGTVFASPVAYYTFLVPAMPHGVTFGAASAFLWAWDGVRREPSRRAWIVAGRCWVF